jgi:amino acid adenylation domain-containing protein
VTALNVLAQLRQAGIGIHAKNGTLKLRGTDEQLTAELRQRVANHKSALLALLAEHPGPQKHYDGAYDAPLSHGQERLLFLGKYAPDVPAYNMTFSSMLSGGLDITSLQSAYKQLSQRHPAFRTGFAKHKTQSISASTSEPLHIVDISNMDASEQQELRIRLASHLFTLDEAPLIRLHLLVADASRHELLLVAHHIVFDMRSADICFNDLYAFYEQEVTGEPAQLDVIPVDYGDYAFWQRQQESAGEHEAALKYWKNELAGAPPALELPTQFPRPPMPTHQGNWLSARLSNAAFGKLTALAHESGCTPFVILFTAFTAFLARICNENDFVIGTPIDNRDHIELENIVGFFLNTLAIRCTIDGNPTVHELLQQTRTQLLNAVAHQELPFEQLVSELQPKRDSSRSPVFQVMCAWHDESASATQNRQGITATNPEIIGLNTAKFDLTLVAFKHHANIDVGFEYSTDLFGRDGAQSLLDRFLLLLDDALTHPDKKLFELQLIKDAEQIKILKEFNNTAVNFDDLCIHELIEQRCRETPQAIALEHGDTQLSYRQLDERANRLANRLVADGIQPGSRAGILLDRSLHFPVALLAVLKAGGAYVPMDPDFPASRLDYLLKDSDIALLLTQSSHIDLVPQAGMTVLMDEFDFESGPADEPTNRCTTNDPAYVIYTSGSTGQPKGTTLTHHGLANLMRWQATQPGLGLPARTLHFAALCFDVSFTEIFTTWDTGGTLVVPSDSLRRDFINLLKFISDENIQRIFLPCAALQPFAETLNQAKLPAAKLTFSEVIVSGEQLTITPTIRSMFDTYPQLRLHNHYGPAETHVVTALTLPEDSSTWPVSATIGTPIANTRIRVLDSSLNVVPIGITGELYIGGDQVGAGYHNRAELNEQRYITDPFIAGGKHRLYRTGDLALWQPDGSIQFCGRADEQEKLRGYRIEPGEVEAALMDSPGVKLAAVAIRNKSNVSSGTAQLVAWVVAEEPARLDAHKLQQQLGDILPEYMVPDAVVFVASLPTTPSGKIDRRALPEPDFADRAKAYVEPRNPIEVAVCECFAEVLNIERVGIQDNFFDLGGQSIIAMQLAARLHDKLQVNLPLKYLFKYPEPESLAQTLKIFSDATTYDTLLPDDSREEFNI